MSIPKAIRLWWSGFAPASALCSLALILAAFVLGQEPARGPALLIAALWMSGIIIPLIVVLLAIFTLKGSTRATLMVLGAAIIAVSIGIIQYYETSDWKCGTTSECPWMNTISTWGGTTVITAVIIAACAVLLVSGGFVTRDLRTRTPGAAPADEVMAEPAPQGGERRWWLWLFFPIAATGWVSFSLLMGWSVSLGGRKNNYALSLATYGAGIVLPILLIIAAIFTLRALQRLAAAAVAVVLIGAVLGLHAYGDTQEWFYRMKCAPQDWPGAVPHTSLAIIAGVLIAAIGIYLAMSARSSSRP